MSFRSANQHRLAVTVVLALVALPFLIYGAWQTMDGIHTSALKWLDPQEPARKTYDRFAEQFDEGPFVLVSWEGCTLDDPRLTDLEATLNQRLAQDKGDPQRLFSDVFSGQSLFRDLTSRAVGLRPAAAEQRLEGALLGADSGTTALVVVLSEYGERNRRRALDELQAIATRVTSLQQDDLHLAGPPVNATAIDLESDRSIDYYVAPSVVVSFLLCAWCLWSLRYALAIIAVAAFGELMMLGALYYGGVQMDAVLIVLPPLVFVLTVSAGIHLVNYFYDQVRLGAGRQAPREAVRKGLLPCGLAALTTAIGLGSLLVSRIVPVYYFGAFASVGVLVAVVLLFLTLPGAMCRWPRAPGEVTSGSATAHAAVYLVRAGRFICRYASAITFLGITLLVVCGFGLTHLRTSVGVDKLLAPGSRVVRDLRWMEEHVANLAPLEIIVTFPPEDELRMVDRLFIVQQLEQAVRRMDTVGGLLSTSSFLPDVPRGRSSWSRRAQFNARLDAARDRLLQTRYLAESEAGQSWRISTRVSSAEGVDFRDTLAAMREIVEPELDRLAKDFKEYGVRPATTYTGVMPIVDQAQHALLSDMYSSMVLAFGLVWVVMVAVLAERPPSLAGAPGSVLKAMWLGTLAMIPNLFPIVAVFGLMGWLGWPADIGSTMTACVALGIAVDDTLHFLAWYRHETAKGDSPVLAIRHTFQHCGRAMIQTTLICGVGMLVFAFSGFVPTRRFALLMFTLLAAALVADLVLLPAILASPLGRVFAVRRPRQAAARPELPPTILDADSEIFLAPDGDDEVGEPGDLHLAQTGTSAKDR